MKLVTYQDASGVHLGALRNDEIVHIDAVAPTADSTIGKATFEYRGEVVSLDSVAPDMLTLIDGGAALLEKARAAFEAAERVQPLSEVKLLAPIPRPRQNIICLGMNYVAHAIEGDRARGREPKLPEHPVYFTKGPNTVCATGDVVPLHAQVTSQLDYEVELAFVIGTGGVNIARDKALAHIFGYTILNDVSAREIQNQHQQFFKGKTLDNTAPMGPCIVTADEIPDPAKLGLRLRLNGETRQDSSVSDLIFDIPTVISIFSQGTTIEAGTIFSTGTPSGVGLGRTPPEYMKAGDVMEAAIDQIGVLRNTVGAE